MSVLGAIILGICLSVFKVVPTDWVFWISIGAWILVSSVLSYFWPNGNDDKLPYDALDELPLLPKEKKRLRLELFETNYGRTSGWYVELNGRQQALLTEPHFVDMFWESYKVEPLPDADTKGPKPDSQEFWAQDNLVFRSARFGLVTKFAFASLYTPYRDGMVTMKGLYIFIPAPTPWERIQLAFRRKKLAWQNRSWL